MPDLNNLKFLESHEWIAVNGNKGRVGISDHAQREISDVVFIELPKVGRVLKQKEATMVVESVKAAFDIYAPVSGKVTAVNKDLEGNPAIVNDSPWDKGWLFELEISDANELKNLMDLKTYDAQKDKGHH